jgi:hypothetical protein
VILGEHDAQHEGGGHASDVCFANGEGRQLVRSRFIHLARCQEIVGESALIGLKLSGRERRRRRALYPRRAFVYAVPPALSK